MAVKIKVNMIIDTDRHMAVGRVKVYTISEK
jgi:hypothetical protein